MSSTPTAIRVSVTKEVDDALVQAKKLYPTLSSAEILKLGLAKIVADTSESSQTLQSKNNIRHEAAHSVGKDYLSDQSEDIYSHQVGKKL